MVYTKENYLKKKIILLENLKEVLFLVQLSVKLNHLV